MRAVRGGLVLLAVGWVVVAGCTSTTKAPDPKTTASAAVAEPFDLSRLSGFNRALPPDFVADPAQVTPTKPEFFDSVGELLPQNGSVTVDPPQCRPMLKPVAGQVEAPSIAMRGDGPDKQAIAVGADDPVTVVSEFPVSGCDRTTINLDGHAGTIERIAVPAIDGASVIALKVVYDGAPNVDYAYAAIVDGHAFVLVQGRLAPDSPAQPLLPDLLVTAVSTLRGQSTQPPPPPTGYDVAGIGGLVSALPPGFDPVPNLLQPYRIGPELVDKAGAFISYGTPIKVEPPPCAVLLKPVQARLGADAMRIRGDQPDSRGISVGAIVPVGASELPTERCARFGFDIDDDRYPRKGTVERIGAPSIDGANTFALKIGVDGSPDPEYSYVAILGGDAYVDVQARVASGWPAETALSDLLVKAVTAIRKG